MILFFLTAICKTLSFHLCFCPPEKCWYLVEFSRIFRTLYRNLIISKCGRFLVMVWYFNNL